ncbi:MAG: glycine cleavage T C-terminal barrel domain-containing protein, partial [Methylocystis sp.]
GKAPVREGAAILAGDGREVGRVTSGGFSPSLARPIAMGYVERALAAPGTSLHAELRGKTVELVVTKLPFAPHRYVHLGKDRK